MIAREKTLTTIAAILLAASALTTFSVPVVGAPCAMLALTMSIYLKRSGAFSQGNAPLAGVVLIGGAGILSIGGGLVVLAMFSPAAAIILFLMMTLPSVGFLMLFAYREKWRRYQKWIEQQDEEPRR